jgi:hypothetical protein
MAVSKNDRAKAAHLRARKKTTPEQRAWLVAYEKRTKRRTPGPLSIARGEVSEASAESSPPGVGSAQPVPVVVHETAPIGDVVAAESQTWIPSVPASDVPEVEEPALAGAPPPPVAGSPLVDEPAPVAAPVDTHAAEQFAMFVVFITNVGIRSALELSATMPIPPEVRGIIADEKAQAEVVGHVAEAAKRVAIKYGLRSIPLADEAIVAAAVGGSAFCYVKLAQSKRKTKPAAVVEASSSTVPAEPRGVGEVSPGPVAMPRDLAGVFG